MERLCPFQWDDYCDALLALGVTEPETSTDHWQLLFQMNSLDWEDSSLMFGDCGRIYFYIPKEDLLVRRFDQVWLVLQCC